MHVSDTALATARHLAGLGVKRGNRLRRNRRVGCRRAVGTMPQPDRLAAHHLDKEFVSDLVNCRCRQGRIRPQGLGNPVPARILCRAEGFGIVGVELARGNVPPVRRYGSEGFRLGLGGVCNELAAGIAVNEVVVLVDDVAFDALGSSNERLGSADHRAVRNGGFLGLDDLGSFRYIQQHDAFTPGVRAVQMPPLQPRPRPCFWHD